MFKIMVCLLVGIPAISYAHDYGCATVGASMESSLFDAIKNDLNIDVATIIKDKTKVEILDISYLRSMQNLWPGWIMKKIRPKIKWQY